jgi:uncharacterized protein YndB with AHSA1/START domain
MSMQEQGGRVAGISDAAVRERTGRSWTEWIAALDREGGRELETAALARLLEDRFDLAGWWSQMVAVGYEEATGRRDAVGEEAGLSATVSRAFDVPVEMLFDLWHDDARRRRWYGADDFAIESAVRPRSLRASWPAAAPQDIAISFTARGVTRSEVTVERRALGAADEVLAVKRHWAEALERLRAHLSV